MNSLADSKALRGAILVIPTVVSLALPVLSGIGLVALMIGFLGLILVGLIGSFRKNKYGIFAQWFDPSGFAAMEMTDREKGLIGLFGCCAIGGGLALVALIMKGP